MQHKITILLALLLFLFSACNGELVKVTEEETFTIEEVFKILDIIAPVGNIDINKAANMKMDNAPDNATVIEVAVVKWTVDKTEEEAQQDLEKITVSHELDGDTYKVVVEAPFDDPGFMGGADLTFNNVQGKQIVIAGNVGDIDCDEIAGGTITTDVGNVVVGEATDTTSLITDTGDVSVGKATEKIEITTNVGNIAVNEFSGSQFTLQSSTGDLDINVTGEGKINGTAVTSVGSMDLGLSLNLSCEVELSTETGNITVQGVDDVEEEAEMEGMNERVRFSLNKGEGKIVCDVEVGSINVQVE